MKSMYVILGLIILAYTGALAQNQPVRLNEGETITVRILPEGIINICGDEPVTLTADPIVDGYKYEWSTGETGPQITVHQSGGYLLEVTAGTFSHAGDTAEVYFHPLPEAKILVDGPAGICDGNSLTLKAKPVARAHYSWSTGQTTESITVTDQGKYYLTVRRDDGCENVDSIIISALPRIEAAIKHDGSLNICDNGSVTLRAEPTGSEYSYKWSNGLTGPVITVKNPGRYRVFITSDTKCTGESFVDVTRGQVEIPGFKDSDLGRVCSGEEMLSSITIKNEQNIDMVFKSISTKLPASEFSVTNSPGSIKPGESVDIKILFSPKKAGHYADSLIIETLEPCEHRLAVEIRADGISKTIIWLPDTTVSIGSSIDLPLSARLVCGDEIPAGAHFTSEIKFEASVLMPEARPNDGLTDKGIVKDERILSLIGTNTGIVDAHGTGLGFITGRVLLADQDVTPLIISNYRWDNDLIDNETKNGSITIKGICRHALSRVKTLTSASLAIAPNPANDHAGLSISGSAFGTVSVSIYSMGGMKLETINADKTGSDLTLLINLENYQAGIYQAVASIDGVTIVEKLMVVK